MTMELISLIVPVYNVAPYLSDCMHSITNQSYQNLEIILINDGSTDNSGEICDQWSQLDARIRVIHQANGGVSHARNVAVQQATGEYIGFVDSDDYIEPNMVELLYENAKKYDVDISCCGIKQISLDGKAQTKFCTGEQSYIRDRETLIINFFANPIYREVLYGPYNKLFKSHIVKTTPFHEDFAIAEDLLFNFECIEKSTSFYLDNQGLYHYIKHPNSATTSHFSIKKFDYIYVADILLNKCKEDYLNAYPEALKWTFVHKLNMCRSLQRNIKLKQDNHAFFKQCYSFCCDNYQMIWKKISLKQNLMFILLKINI